jgi:hypothetical protein
MPFSGRRGRTSRWTISQSLAALLTLRRAGTELCQSAHQPGGQAYTRYFSFYRQSGMACTDRMVLLRNYMVLPFRWCPEHGKYTISEDRTTVPPKYSRASHISRSAGCSIPAASSGSRPRTKMKEPCNWEKNRNYSFVLQTRKSSATKTN